MKTVLRCSKGCLLATVEGDEIEIQYRLDNGKREAEVFSREAVEEIPVRARCKHQAHEFGPGVFDLAPGKRLLKVEEFTPADQIGHTVSMAEARVLADEIAATTDFEAVRRAWKNLGN